MQRTDLYIVHTQKRPNRTCVWSVDRELIIDHPIILLYWMQMLNFPFSSLLFYLSKMKLNCWFFLCIILRLRECFLSRTYIGITAELVSIFFMQFMWMWNMFRISSDKKICAIEDASEAKFHWNWKRKKKIIERRQKSPCVFTSFFSLKNSFPMQ